MVKNTTKMIRISPRKMMLAANVARGLNAKRASDSLKMMPKKCCEILAKSIDGAIANARQKKYDVNSLIISEINVGRGPMFTRFMPRAKGRACNITKYTTNITVFLTGQLSQIEDATDNLGGEQIQENM